MSRIILAEDDEIVGEAVVDALMDAGHAVGWLRDGQAALNAMKFRTPHLAILDIHMPVLGGMETLRQMRGSDTLAVIPVLMLTAMRGESSQNIAYFDGADDYITKPFDLDDLVVRAEALIKNKKHSTLSLSGLRPKGFG